MLAPAKMDAVAVALAIPVMDLISSAIYALIENVNFVPITHQETVQMKNVPQVETPVEMEPVLVTQLLVVQTVMRYVFHYVIPIVIHVQMETMVTTQTVPSVTPVLLEYQ